MNSKKAFTLIELMVVIAIMGILAAIAVPTIFIMSAKAKYCSGVSKSEQSLCIEQFEHYYATNPTYFRDEVNNGRRYSYVSDFQNHTQTSLPVESITQSKTGFKELSNGLVLFYATNNEQLAQDIETYKRTYNKNTIKNVIPSPDGKTGPIMEFTW